MGYVVAATWTAEPDKAEIVKDAITKLAPPSRQEPGNQYYQAYQDPEVPHVFHLFEIYDDEAAYRAHGESEHFQEYGAGQAIPVLTDRARAFYETFG
ncbi:putative quinol monooxygenase [Flexivirga oryzae]|uniref:Quinol monooxygenase YgiN n=1 Tax=Flexivirga oryzae TaxID=1794944 RepID=A0A839N8C4_9MICO|nr:putative quinol monooxygenase [Flexivirga oryzae]MBB2891876.1 quinol monooxygenase YgiN [Flexivirga oryzae]